MNHIKKVMFFILIIFTVSICSAKELFEKQDIILNKSLAGLTIVGSYYFDEQIRYFSQNNLNVNFSSSLTTEHILGFSGILYLSSFFADDEKYSKTSFQSLSSGIISSGVVYGLKIFFGRARPYVELGKNDFSFFRGLDGDDYRSFVSGHSALSWAIFTPYAKKYSNYIYVIPLFISILRILEDKHWTSDVIVGSLIGYTVGTLFFEKDFYFKLF
jgi:membrane-associated phospholipid phosphatase